MQCKLLFLAVLFLVKFVGSGAGAAGTIAGADAAGATLLLESLIAERFVQHCKDV